MERQVHVRIEFELQTKLSDDGVKKMLAKRFGIEEDEISVEGAEWEGLDDN